MTWSKRKPGNLAGLNTVTVPAQGGKPGAKWRGHSLATLVNQAPMVFAPSTRQFIMPPAAQSGPKFIKSPLHAADQRLQQEAGKPYARGQRLLHGHNFV